MSGMDSFIYPFASARRIFFISRETRTTETRNAIPSAIGPAKRIPSILGLVRPQDGGVSLCAADGTAIEMNAETRHLFAYVPQGNTIISGTIAENMRMVKEDATDEEMIRVCRLAQADPFIQEFPDKYDTYIEQGGSNVSGGQKQRLCIARALLKHPKILILDDSTSAVDTKTDALIRKAFLEEIPDTTKFIIAQRVSSIEDADKILVMDGGAIVAMGTHEELLKTCDIYRETYESQVKGGSDDEQ